MAKLTAAQRRALPKSDFAVPSKAPGPGSFPEPDKGHEKAAIGRTKAGSAARKAVTKLAAKKGFIQAPKPTSKKKAK